jgi:hypothetical protein
MDIAMMNLQNFFNYKRMEFPPKFSIRENEKINYYRNVTNFSKFQNQNNFTYFLHNSNWNIELSTDNESNKNNVENLHGIIDKNDIPKFNKLNNIFPNFDLVLPINIKENQMLIFDSNQEKIFLKYIFPINLKNGSLLRNVNKDLINQIFDFKLSGELYDKNIFSEPIHFQVKGFDIVKSIVKNLNNKGINIQSKEKKYKVLCTVFNNIQLTFLTEFSISFENLTKIYTFPIKKITSINEYNIKINKIILIYCLQYTSLIRKINALNYYNANYYLHKKLICQKNMKINNKFNENKKINKPYFNYSNWHNFMTLTTPIIYEKDDLPVMNIFNSIIKPSILGIDVNLKDEKNIFHNVRYFPVIGKIFIETEKLNISPSNSTKSSSNSFNFNDIIYEKKLQTIFFFNENHTFINEIPSYSQQIRSFIENNPEINDVILNEVSDNSYFSLIWIPSCTYLNYNYCNKGKICKFEMPIFQIYYKFKSLSQCSYKIQFLSVIGIREKNYKSNNNYTVFNNIDSEIFWFKNQYSSQTKNNFLVDINNNFKLYNELISYVESKKL